MGFIVTYGEGGFDPSKPNNNIVETIEVPEIESIPEDLLKESALNKLKNLGLTEEEILTILGENNGN